MKLLALAHHRDTLLIHALRRGLVMSHMNPASPPQHWRPSIPEVLGVALTTMDLNDIPKPVVSSSSSIAQRNQPPEKNKISSDSVSHGEVLSDDTKFHGNRSGKCPDFV